MEIKKVNDEKIQYCFEVSTLELEQHLALAYDKIKHKVEIKGFRKGHVPRKIFETRFGKDDLYANALEGIVQNRYKDILEKKDFESIGIPKIVDLKEKKFKKKQDFTFSLEFNVKPKVILGSYLGLKINKENLEVKDEEITAKINTLFDSKVELISKSIDVLEKEDTAIFDFQGLLDGNPFEGGTAKNFNLEIGSKQFVPGFEEQMIGMKKGETKNIEITFPSDYNQKKLSNQKVIFKVTLHEIKTKQKIELTDEMIVSLQYSEIKTLEELKNKIKEDLLKQKKKQHDIKMEKEVIDQITKNTQLTIPQDIIEEEKKHLQNEFQLKLQKQNLTLEQYQKYLGITKETMEKDWQEQAKKYLEYQLIMEQIALEQNIIISPEQIEKCYQQLSQINQLPLEKIKNNLKPQSLKKSLLLDEALKLVMKSVVFADQ
ncbi:trigger factor [Candidatus Phytoplasma solani]|uniref:trigger factor n=1 Tax=Candidatus Phytoplasma solani TaxID=69896 RepID=UPI0032DAD8F6